MSAYLLHCMWVGMKHREYAKLFDQVYICTLTIQHH